MNKAYVTITPKAKAVTDMGISRMQGSTNTFYASPSDYLWVKIS
jgi:hypothetical protein